MLKMKEIFKRNNGFGIVEAIIALAILAIAVAALMQTTSVMFDSLSTDNRITRDNTFCENVFNDIGLIYDDTFDTYEAATVNTNSSDAGERKLTIDGAVISDDTYTSFNEGTLSVPSISNNLEVYYSAANDTQYDLEIKNPFILYDSTGTSALSDNNGIYILDNDETFNDYNEFLDVTSRDEIFINNREENSGIVVNDSTTTYSISTLDMQVSYNYCNSSYASTTDTVSNALIVQFDELGDYPTKTPYGKSPTLNGIIIEENDVGAMIASWERVCLATSNCTSDSERDCVDNALSGLDDEEISDAGDLYFLFTLKNSILDIDNGDPISFTYLETTEVDGFRVEKTYQDSFSEGSDMIKLDDGYESDLTTSLGSPFIEIVDGWRTLANEKLRHNDVDIVISCEATASDGNCDSSSRVASCQVNNSEGAHMKFSRVFRKAL